MRGLLFFLDAVGKATTCRLLGHEASWRLGIMFGFDRPVCRRCRRVL